MTTTRAWHLKSRPVGMPTDETFELREIDLPQLQDGWVRVGAASEAVNPIGLYLGGGFTFGDERRKLGFGLSHARLGNPAIAASAGRADRAETAFEATAEFRLSDNLAVQPDLQYIVNPGWEPSRRDAVVAGLRLKFDLELN